LTSYTGATQRPANVWLGDAGRGFGVPAELRVCAAGPARSRRRQRRARSRAPGTGANFIGSRCCVLRSLGAKSFVPGGVQVRAPIEAAKRVLTRSMTRWLSWANVVEVQVDSDGRIHPRSAPHGDAWGISLPWRISFPVGAQRKPLVLIAQRKGGGDAGPVTCTITVDGKLLASTTADGQYAAPECSGSG